MAWFGIALFIIGSVWFVFAPDAKSTSPSKKLTKKKKSASTKRARRRSSTVETLRKGVQVFFKEDFDEPRDTVISAADDNRARPDEFIVHDKFIFNEPLNGDFVHTPMTDESHDESHHESHHESYKDWGHSEQNARHSLWTTPVSQLTRTQLEMLLKAYFENESTGYELGHSKHKKPVNHGRQL